MWSSSNEFRLILKKFVGIDKRLKNVELNNLF